jgi:hypothetical protein
VTVSNAEHGAYLSTGTILFQGIKEVRILKPTFNISVLTAMKTKLEKTIKETSLVQAEN